MTIHLPINTRFSNPALLKFFAVAALLVSSNTLVYLIQENRYQNQKQMSGQLQEQLQQVESRSVKVEEDIRKSNEQLESSKHNVATMKLELDQTKIDLKTFQGKAYNLEGQVVQLNQVVKDLGEQQRVLSTCLTSLEPVVESTRPLLGFERGERQLRPGQLLAALRQGERSFNQLHHAWEHPTCQQALKIAVK